MEPLQQTIQWVQSAIRVVPLLWIRSLLGNKPQMGLGTRA